MDLNTAINIAMSTPGGTPPYYLAYAVCQMRNVDPNAMMMGWPLTNWQGVVAEHILGAAIADMVLAATPAPSPCFPYGAPEPGQRNADDMGMPPR